MESGLEKALGGGRSDESMSHRLGSYLKLVFIGRSGSEMFGENLMNRGLIGIPFIVYSTTYMHSLTGAGLFLGGVSLAFGYIGSGLYFVRKKENREIEERLEEERKEMREGREKAETRFYDGLARLARQNLDYYGDGYGAHDFYGNKIVLKEMCPLPGNK